MNIITGTKQNLTDAFMHYVCLRFQFRSSMLSEPTSQCLQGKSVEHLCPAKHPD